MSLEDLAAAGLLLPQDDWGKAPPPRGPRVRLALVGAATVLAAWLMWAGDGRLLTWAGLGLFLAALAAFTALSLRAVR